MKKLMLGMAAACAMLTAGAANTYYVDAVNGNDSYDGLAAAWDGEHGPIRTLANIANLVTATTKENTVGDTVYVAEGDYNFGSDATGKYRAAVTNGVRLVGVGDRNKIRVFGSATDAKAGTEADAMRCLRLGKWTLIKNVTLCNGRTTGNGACATVEESKSAYFVGCVISNNYAFGASSSRGGAFSGGRCIRCLFTKNECVYIAKSMNGGIAWNCVFKETDSYATYQAQLYNCTFVDTGTPRDSSETVSYNLLGVGNGKNQANQAKYAYSFFSYNIAAANLAVGSQANLGTEALQIGSDFGPVYGANLGIDSGTNETYEANFPTSALVADQKYLDFNGNPRIVGGTIDAGACEYDPAVRTLTITDAQTALVVTGAAKGETILRKGATNTFTLARNYSTAKLCTGVRVNGEFFSFTGDNADRTYEYTYGYGDPTAALTIEAVYAEHNDWYVDAVNGNDANNGYTSYQAKKTLKGAMENPLLASGDTVHAAPGVYNEGTMSSGGYTTNRVIVAAGVTLVADQGPDVTAIEGFIPGGNDGKDKSRWGGTDPIRGVLMETDASLRGFTVRNSMVAMGQGTGTQYGGNGGGIYGGTAIDCVVSNCWAVRGGGTADARLIRCWLTDNKNIPGSTKNPAGGTASSTAGAMQGGSAYDSFIDTAYAMNLDEARNCRFFNVGRNGSGSTSIYNCYVQSDNGFLKLYSSVLLPKTKSEKSTFMDDNCVANTTLKFDANGRPDKTDATTAQYAIDKGNKDYYVYPKAVADEAGKDFAGGQRIYNGQIDVGCGEYDWRGEYTRKLGTRRAEVTAATAEVELVDDALTVGAGGTLTFRVTLAAQGGKVSFTAGGTVKVDGETLTPVEGVYSFIGTAGTSYVVTVTAADAPVTVSAVTVPKRGIVVVIK